MLFNALKSTSNEMKIIKGVTDSTRVIERKMYRKKD